MIFRSTALLLIAALAAVLSGCAPERSESPSERWNFVQDMWVIEQIMSVNSDDVEVDLTEVIVTEFASQEPSASVTLRDGVIFHQYDSLAPKVIDVSSVGRADIDIRAGFTETSNGRALTVLASPQRGADAPIGFGDYIAFDLSFVGERLSPGDPLLFDYAFLQTLPEDSPEDARLEGAELTAHRMAAGRVQYAGIPGETGAQLYTSELGMALAGSTFAGLPSKSQPMMDGFNRGLKECLKPFKGPTLKCVSKYFEEFEGGISVSVDLIEDNLNFYDEQTRERRSGAPTPPPTRIPTTSPPPEGIPTTSPPPEGIPTTSPPPTQPPNTDKPRCVPGFKCGWIRGDPHFMTFNGASFSMQGVGEYVAAESDELVIQTRLAQAGPQVSMVSAVAVSVDGHRVVVEHDSVHIDGGRVDAGSYTVGGARVDVGAHRSIIRSPDGTEVWITPTRSWYLDVVVSVPDPVDGFSGLLASDVADHGAAAAGFAVADGSVLPAPLTFEQMYQQFAESWRITDRSSLFDYAPGENTDTFTDRSFPSRVFTAADLLAPVRAQAERMCRAANIVDDTIFGQCVLDFGALGGADDVSVLGELAMIRSARQADTLVGVRDGWLTPDGAERAESAGSTPRRVRPPGDQTTSKDALDVPVPDHQAYAGDDRSTSEDGFEGQDASWSVSGDELFDEKPFASIVCAADGNLGELWGTKRYLGASSVCSAAVHDGRISREFGGLVSIHVTDSVTEYLGTTSNGVTSGGRKTSAVGFYFTEP